MSSQNSFYSALFLRWKHSDVSHWKCIAVDIARLEINMTVTAAAAMTTAAGRKRQLRRGSKCLQCSVWSLAQNRKHRLRWCLKRAKFRHFPSHLYQCPKSTHDYGWEELWHVSSLFKIHSECVSHSTQFWVRHRRFSFTRTIGMPPFCLLDIEKRVRIPACNRTRRCWKTLEYSGNILWFRI